MPKPQEKSAKKLRIERFFDEITMSVHLRENTPPYAKKGAPGNWEPAEGGPSRRRLGMANHLGRSKSQHMILALAKTYKRPSGDHEPAGCHYDLRGGAWIVDETGERLVESLDHPRPRTKKEDVETGEDQKSE